MQVIKLRALHVLSRPSATEPSEQLALHGMIKGLHAVAL